MSTIQDILDSIEDRLRELNAEITTLTAARTALDQRTPRPSSLPPLTATDRNRPRAEPHGETLALSEAAPIRAHDASSTIRDGETRSSRRGRGRTRRRRARRSVAVVPAGKLELLLSDADGLTTSSLAERASGDRDQVLAMLRELEAAGRVRRTGQRRATRWHAITDEERIQQRAAELAAMIKPAA